MSNLTIPSLQDGHGVQHQPQGLTQNGRIACIVLCAFSALSCVGTSVLSALAYTGVLIPFTGVLILIGKPVVLLAFACCALIVSIAFGILLIDTRRGTVQEEVEDINNNKTEPPNNNETTESNINNLKNYLKINKDNLEEYRKLRKEYAGFQDF